MDYKKSIITPKTAFPMKAGLPNREPGMLQRWEEMDLYNALLEKNKDLPPFVLHDGPPFSNGYIHMAGRANPHPFRTLEAYRLSCSSQQLPRPLRMVCHHPGLYT